MLYQEIITENILALKEGRKDDRAVLTLLISKLKNRAIDLKQESLDDKDCIQIITKFIKSLDEEIVSFSKANRLDKVKILNKQKEVVSKFLPPLLSEDKVKELISKLDDKSIKSVMQYFKQNYQGQVDMGLVSKIAKQFN